MSNFARAYAFLRPIEGNLVDDSQDPGGITNLGISLRFATTVTDLAKDGHPLLDVDGDGDVDADDIRKLDPHRAEVVYEHLFWKPLHCDELIWPVAIQVFDSGVNQGRGAAVVLLQEAVNVVTDGKFGPITLAAAKHCSPVEFQARRNVRYAHTLRFHRFGLGWMRRSSKAFNEGFR